MSKKKKEKIIKLDEDLSFDELVSRIANAKAEDVEEAIRNEEDEPAVKEEDCEPPQEC